MLAPRWKHNALLHRWEYLLGGEVVAFLEDELWDIPGARDSLEASIQARFSLLALPKATLTL